MHDSVEKNVRFNHGCDPSYLFIDCPSEVLICDCVYINFSHINICGFYKQCEALVSCIVQQ